MNTSHQKKGYEYWQFKFKFENTSDTDQNVSTMMDWECYADNSKADQQWIGDDSGLDATLSAGRQTEGTVYFEVPKDSNILNWNTILTIGRITKLYLLENKRR